MMRLTLVFKSLMLLFITHTLYAQEITQKKPRNLSSQGLKKVEAVLPRPVSIKAGMNATDDSQSTHLQGWQVVAPKDEEFSVKMPFVAKMEIHPDPDNPNKKIRYYRTSSDGGVFLITSKDISDYSAEQSKLDFQAKLYEQNLAKSFVQNSGEGKITKKQNVNINGLGAYEYHFLMGSTPGISRIYTAKHRAYILTWLFMVAADLPGEPRPYWFLDSFSLGSSNTTQTSTGVIDDAAEVNFQGGIGAGSGGGGGTTGWVKKTSPRKNSTAKDQSNRRIYTATEVSRRAAITHKPDAAYTEEARNNGVQGTVVLIAVLMPTGHVTGIKVQQGLPDGLTEAAIVAAKKLKFVPANKDGRDVSQLMRLEYNFNLF